MKYIIADYKLLINGEKVSLFKDYLKSYEAEFVNPDFEINCIVNDEISFTVSDSDINGVGKFSWQIAEDGTVLAFIYSQEHKKCLAKIKWNIDYTRADVYIVDTCLLDGLALDAVLFGLVGQAFYYILMFHHAYVFHSSAIEYKNNAILFSAPSGTGKSTQTHMWKKLFPEDVNFINDDTPILRIKNNELYAYGSPWAGKNRLNNNISAKVKGIICLEQFDKIAIKKLSGLDAFFRIYNETNKPVIPVLADIFLNDINELLKITDVYLMKCNINEETVFKVKELFNLY